MTDDQLFVLHLKSLRRDISTAKLGRDIPGVWLKGRLGSVCLWEISMAAVGAAVTGSWFPSPGLVGLLVLLLLLSIFLAALCSDCNRNSFELQESKAEKHPSALIRVVKLEEVKENPMIGEIQKDEKGEPCHGPGEGSAEPGGSGPVRPKSFRGNLTPCAFLEEPPGGAREQRSERRGARTVNQPPVNAAALRRSL
ncbi:uncharacterized protein FYW61_000067 isoform 4-T9 [Anableps anableps]